MLYGVDIRRERASFSKMLADIREWLDAKRFEPERFGARRKTIASSAVWNSKLRARLLHAPHSLDGAERRGERRASGFLSG